ncbi:MAG TPA: coenzyme F420-0:L-glutamate ligase [Candidatus Paceibacterota bacterium]|nr:coenzyme F420-0:L-glutamate ligase [Candidatus Paceibacterota bacterium]
MGILITDSRSIPLREGTIGRALGFSGFEPLKSYVGKKDLFGRKTRVTKSNLADALAAAAVMEMGEGDEQTPLAVIKDALVVFTTKPLSAKAKKLFLDPEKDIFAGVYLGVEGN